MNERKMTVSKVKPKDKWEKPIASIRLTGRWVEKLGFGVGDEFVVRESPGHIQIIAKWMITNGLLRSKEV